MYAHHYRTEQHKKNIIIVKQWYLCVYWFCQAGRQAGNQSYSMLTAFKAIEETGFVFMN
jgi:hypothetical protein